LILKELILKNFRGYRNEHRISIGQLTAFIGKNEAGKSTILDSLAIFFDHPLVKIDESDVCVQAGDPCEVRIGAIFSDFPNEITIDATSVTSLEEEFLLNRQGYLEIQKVFEFSDGRLKKPKIMAIANHPTSSNIDGLLNKKNVDLKKLEKGLA